MGSSHWSDYHRRWSRLDPPLRPHRDVVDAVRRAVQGHGANVLLLGVTPELADIGENTIAVDRNPAMIANIWPGDAEHRRAQCGDWRSLDLPGASMTAAIGDGAINMLLYPQDQAVLYAQLGRVLRPGAPFACRLFVTPDRAESIDSLVAATRAREVPSFNAFKWRLAMAMAADSGNPNVAVVSIRDCFIRHFSDRSELSLVTGWARDAIDTIDAYENSLETYSFPTLAQFRAVIPDGFENLNIVPVGSYPLAERCPLLTMVRAS